MEFSCKITERKIANEPSRNDICLTDLVQIIPKQKAFNLYLLDVTYLLLDLFRHYHASQLFF